MENDYMDDIKVSVIIPVYNSEKYLKKCMESVLAQTLKDIEIIVIDDGSTDDSFNILKEYENSDFRVKLYSQDNRGAGAARNAGLSKAKGDYLLFLDSDDFFEPDMLQMTYDRAKETNADIVIFGSDQYYTEENEFRKVDWVVRQDRFPNTVTFNHKQIRGNVFKSIVGWAWDKLFSRYFIEKNNLKFQELRTSNDLYFVFSALIFAETISFVKDTFVHQRRDSSASLSKTRELSWGCFYEALIGLKSILIKRGFYDGLERDYINYALHFTLWNLNTLAESSRKKLIRKLNDEWLYDLGIAEKNEDYFYNAAEYQQYKDYGLIQYHKEGMENEL